MHETIAPDPADELLALQLLAEQVIDRPNYLAHHLAYFDDGFVARVLDCDAATAATLRLCRTPRPYSWRRDVCTIATQLGLIDSALVNLLHLAEAIC